MTTFADREHAIEAHHAILELARFQDRLHRYKALGLTVARRLGLRGQTAEFYAARLAERCVLEPNDQRLCMRLAIELAVQGVDLSPWDIGRIVAAGAEPAHPALTSDEPGRSWVAFVMGQLLMLFGMSPSGSKLKDVAGTRRLH